MGWLGHRLLLLLAMAAVLLTGAWKTHPLPSLVLPLVAGLAWHSTIRERRVEQWLLFYVLGIYVYTVLRAFADEAGFPIQAGYVIAVDRLLFMGTVPSESLQQAFFSPQEVDWLDAAATAVHVSFFVVPHAALLLIWRWRPSALPMYVLSMLLLLYLGLGLFFLVPTMPPWLAGRDGELAETYRVLDFVLRGVDTDAYRSLYAALAEPNSVAAMPSVHMAVTFMLLIRARSMGTRWVFPLQVYTLLMALSLVYLGEHYVFDLIVGVALAVVAEALSRRLDLRRWQPSLVVAHDASAAGHSASVLPPR